MCHVNYVFSWYSWSVHTIQKGGIYLIYNDLTNIDLGKFCYWNIVKNMKITQGGKCTNTNTECLLRKSSEDDIRRRPWWSVGNVFEIEYKDNMTNWNKGGFPWFVNHDPVKMQVVSLLCNYTSSWEDHVARNQYNYRYLKVSDACWQKKTVAGI